MSSLTSAPNPFSIDSPKGPIRRTLLNTLRGPIESLLGLAALGRRYASINRSEGTDFLTETLRTFKVSFAVSQADVARIPASGPLIVVANHPFGGLDGIILASIIRKIRPDAKVMANYILGRIPELRDMMIFVDPFGGANAARANLATLRASIKHLKSGGALIIFPAGEVSHVDLRKRAVLDSPWSDTVARMIRMTKAAALPAYFHGHNSRLFNFLGMIHPILRTALLPREFLNKEHSQLRVEIGNPIPGAKLTAFETDADLTAYLRLRTYILQTRKGDGSVTLSASDRALAAKASQSPIAPAGDAAAITREVAALPASSLVLENAEYAIHIAEASAIPETLGEIARLREITFRATHEGTGKPRDLDAFDSYYLHLFCWSKSKNEIVGAYRLGQTDVILPSRGVKGFYTRTLFSFDTKLLDQLGPALELGRSFIRLEYQRSYAPLLMLWKGIGAYAAANPKYQILFGPVSINNEYQSISRQLIMTFLRTYSFSHLASLIRATNPPRIRPLKSQYLEEYSTVVRDIDEVSDLVQEIESDRKGIPVLLKQYMKLGARMLGFNIDPEFGHVLDGLILVDFRKMPPKLLERFCGKDGAASLRAYQAAHPV